MILHPTREEAVSDGISELRNRAVQECEPYEMAVCLGICNRDHNGDCIACEIVSASSRGTVSREARH